MAATWLSEQQMAFFETFGYLHFPGLMADCIDRIIEEFEVVWVAHGGGLDGPHDGADRSIIIPFADQSEYLSALLDDPRIHDIAACICGEDFNYWGGDGNLYVSDTFWHSDGYSADRILTIKMALYLDRLSHDTGVLRVIPGSHHVGDVFGEAVQQGVLQGRSVTAEAPQINWGVDGQDVPAVALENVPGDVVVFNENLKHSSFGGTSRRRMFVLSFSRRYPEDQHDALMGAIHGCMRVHAEAQLGEHVHGEAMVRTAGPERMVHLEQIRANEIEVVEWIREREKAG